MLGLHPIEYARETTAASRASQHPQRMAGRRHVDDDELESAVAPRAEQFRAGPPARQSRAAKAATASRTSACVQPRPAQGDLLERRPPRRITTVRAPVRASISAAYSEPRPTETRRGLADSGQSSASPSDGAGSVEMTSVGVPRAADATAIDAAQVVLPTPPLPPMK